MGNGDQRLGARARALLKRRELFAAPLLAMPSTVRAQGQARLPRIGVIHWEGPDSTFRITEALQAMASAGLRDGVNVAFYWRWAAGSRARAAEAAIELEKSGAAVIYAYTTPVAHAVKDTVTRTPVVFNVSDALSTGIVNNLTRPGGLLTGVMSSGPELAPKRLEILREAVPHLGRVGFLGSSIDPNAETFIRETSAAARQIGIDVLPVRVRGPEEFAAALDRMLADKVQATIVQTLFLASARAFIEPAIGRGLASVGDQPLFAEQGALVAFGADRANLAERAAALIDRVLKGASPGDIPVEAPSKFWLVVNQKTARTLGLTLPSSLLIRADEVIE
jgi:putative tryptophan/tyrosine transport system substrate-binding protein